MSATVVTADVTVGQAQTSADLDRCQVDGCGRTAIDIVTVGRTRLVQVCGVDRFQFHQALIEGTVRTWSSSVTL